MPATAFAGDPQQGKPQTSLRAAIDRAASKASIQKITPAPGQATSSGTRMQGGGGATYYMVKQMQKTTSSLQTTGK